MIAGFETHLDALRRAAQSEPLGLYLHIPFCVDRCTYCSFTTSCDHSRKAQTLQRLEGDMVAWGRSLARPVVDTLYLGGGTPSTLTLAELEYLTHAVREAFDTTGLREATLEANPGTASADWMAGARRLGWDRMSLGIQTLDDSLLKRLGRIHDGREGLAALARARRAGFARINADLMIGIPGQDLSRVRADAQQIAAAGATHLSIYMLDLDKACPMKRAVEAGLLALPPEDVVAEAFELLQETLPTLGFTAYEISNYALPGETSIHNTRYWERRPYLGLGPSAASHLAGRRWTECSDLNAWTDGQAPAPPETLSPLEELAEIPLLGLRMLRGIDWEALRAQAERQGLLSHVARWEEELKPFFQHGLLQRKGNILSFTRKGLLLSNLVLELFV